MQKIINKRAKKQKISFYVLFFYTKNDILKMKLGKEKERSE